MQRRQCWRRLLGSLAAPVRKQAAEEAVIEFGEHRGKRLGDLPSGYLGFIASHFRGKPEAGKQEWACRAQEILDARNAKRAAGDKLKRQLVVEVDRSTSKATVPQVLQQLDSQEVEDPSVVYGSLLRRCIRVRSLADGKLVHEHILRSGSGKNRYLGNLLMQMYGKCSGFGDARQVFDSIQNKNDRTYGIMMSLYVQQGRPMEALELWKMMEEEGIKADGFIVTSALAACTSLRAVEEGRGIHEHLVISEFRMDAVLETTLLRFYSKCGCVDDAKRVFEGMKERDLHCYSAMISALAHNGLGREALVCYRRMIAEGMEPNAVVYSAVLGTCAKLGTLEEGRAVHSRMLEKKVPLDEVLHRALYFMYLKCGDVREAKKLEQFVKEPKQQRSTLAQDVSGGSSQVAETEAKQQHSTLAQDVNGGSSQVAETEANQVHEASDL